MSASKTTQEQNIEFFEFVKAERNKELLNSILTGNLNVAETALKNGADANAKDSLSGQ